MAIQLKRSLSSQLDPSYVLAQGQIGIEMPGATNTESAPFKAKIGDGNSIWSSLPYFGASTEVDLSSVVPVTRTINSKPLSSDIILDATDVGARAGSWMPTAADVGARPSDWMPSASDVGARPNTWNPTLTDCSGVLSVAQGGTGTTSLDALKTSLGISGSGGAGTSTQAVYSTLDSGYCVSWMAKDPWDHPNDTDVRSLPRSYIVFSEDESTRGTDWSLNAPLSGISLEAQSTYDTSTNRMRRSGILFGINDNISGHSALTLQYRPDTNKFTVCGGGWNLGDDNCMFQAVYCMTGSVQTSDRSKKHHIVYLSEANAAMTDAESPTGMNPDLSTVIQFVQDLNPATFLYNTEENDPVDAKDRPENLQLGLIADDLESSPLFPYIGAKFTSEEGTHLALKPLPVAVAALTVCKYLLQRVELLEEQHAS